MTIFDLIVEEVLNEISPEQAYENFYNKLPREDFDKIVSANGKFDGLVKFLLNEYMEKNTTFEECIELIKAYKSIDNKARITISDKIKKKEYESLDEFIYDLTHTEEITRLSKSSLIKNGYVEIARLGNWVLTATLTYEANKKHFGYTQWCTASDRLGNYDGYMQFKNYTIDSDSSLIQLTNITNKGETYQLQINKFGNFGQICNVKDNSMSGADIKQILGYNNFESLIKIIDDNYREWIINTRKLAETEEEYQASMEKYLDAKIKRREAKKRRLQEESKQLNIRLCQEVEKKFDEFKEKKLYENLDFVNSLSTFDEIYNDNNIEKIEQYFSTHNNALILSLNYMPNGLIIAPIIVKVPYYYGCNEDSLSIEKRLDVNYSSWWDFDNVRGYVTNGVTIIAEEGDENGLFKRIIRVAFEINCTGGFYIADSVNGLLGNRAFCFGADSNKGLLYLPSNGKTYKLICNPLHYSVFNTGDMTILQSYDQYFVFSKFCEEVLDYEYSHRCSSECGHMCVLTHQGEKFSTLYTDNKLLEGGKLVINDKVDFLTGYSLIRKGGAFAIATTLSDRKFGIIADKERNSVYTVFDIKESSEPISLFCDGDSLVYTRFENGLMYYDIRTQQYFLIKENEKVECDVYGNPIGEQQTQDKTPPQNYRRVRLPLEKKKAT